MGTKREKKLSGDDACIYTLGACGLTEKTPLESSKAIESISEACNNSFKTAKSMFYRANDKELFKKIGDTPSLYVFTKKGFDRYLKMKEQEVGLKGAQNTLEDLIKKFYWDEFIECVESHKELIEIKFSDIETHLGLDFAASILDNPVMLDNMNEIIKNVDLPTDDDFRPRISLIDLYETYNVEEVKQPENVGKLASVEGRVMTQTEPEPRLIVAAFKCQRCDHVSYVPQTDGMWIEPYECENEVCGRRGAFKFIPEESETINSQYLYLESAQGQAQLVVRLDKSLCAPVWERDAKFVRVVGALRLRQISKNGLKKLEYFLEANSIRLSEDSAIQFPTEEDKKLFDEWGRNPLELRKKLIGSFAPHIYGKEEIKDALSLSHFSDWVWHLKPENALDRSSLHILLIGDPGVAKSQLLRENVRLAPRVALAQGENTTAAGLSNACVLNNGTWQIRAGVFAKGDGGLVVVDELDKIREEDLKCLQSILEYQQQIVDKAGQHVKFPCRCAALCGANPKSGHLNGYDPIIDQISKSIKSYLFQRFDLIFVMRDTPDSKNDSLIYDKVSESHRNSSVGDSAIERPISPDMYKKYVLHACSKAKPEMSKEADQLIKGFYMNLRKDTGNRDDRYPIIGARSAATLIKLATAVARRELNPVVTEEHATYAMELYKKSVIGLSLSGILDFAVLEHGGTQAQLNRIKLIHEALISMTKELPATIQDIVKFTGYSETEVKHTLRNLSERGEVIEVKSGLFRAII